MTKSLGPPRKCCRSRPPRAIRHADGPSSLWARPSSTPPYLFSPWGITIGSVPRRGGVLESRASNDTDVLIVGAGPVGLFLANECARRALRWRIIEERPAQSEHSKALAIFPRTLEIFDMAGVVAPFLSAANRVTEVAIVTHGKPLAHMRFAPEESPYPFIAMVPQNVTESLLVQELRRKGAGVEHETTFVAAETQGAWV